MNWVDLVIILVTITFALEGLKRGFFSQVLDIIGFFVSLIFALALYHIPGQLLVQYFSLPKIAANPVGFLLTWIIVETLFFAFLSKFLRRSITVLFRMRINKYLGFIPAAANSLLFLSFILLFIVSLPLNPNFKKDIFDSRIGSTLIDGATVLERPFNSIFGPIAKEGLTFLTVKPEEKGSLSLGFTQTNVTVDSAAEQEMFRLLNQERVKRGFKELAWDERLARVGRSHSKDMFARGYFSHYSPEGKDVGDRVDEQGIAYTLAGENLALAPNVNRAHEGLMNSPGHKRNILDPAFSKIGIGAIDGGIYGEMFTQVFTN